MSADETPDADDAAQASQPRKTRSQLLDEEPDLFGLREHFAEIESARNAPRVSLLDDVRRLRELLAVMEEAAVIAERQRQTPWERLSESLGVTKATAINRYKAKVDTWAQEHSAEDGFGSAWRRLEATWAAVEEITARRAAAMDMQLAADAIRDPSSSPQANPPAVPDGDEAAVPGQDAEGAGAPAPMRSRKLVWQDSHTLEGLYFEALDACRKNPRLSKYEAKYDFTHHSPIKRRSKFDPGHIDGIVFIECKSTRADRSDDPGWRADIERRLAALEHQQAERPAP